MSDEQSEKPTSASITTLDEACEFYAKALAGARTITCHGEPVTIVFERATTHTYTEGVNANEAGALPPEELLIRKFSRHTEYRRFSLRRAQLLDRILPAISGFQVSVPEGGGPPGRQKRILYGPPISATDQERMRVILRPGPGDSWTCVSAYPVSVQAYISARRIRRAKFPP